jgi:hypothetical protein
MSNNNGNSSSGVSTLGLLGIVFVVLKLTEVIAWSWWWVTAPFWGGLALLIGGGLLSVVFGVLVVGVVYLLGKTKK